MTCWRSPVDGTPLRLEGSYALSDGRRRWPLVDGIPFLRVGRELLADAALERLDAGQPGEALALLLTDQDDWWTGPTAEPEAVLRLVRDSDRLSLREAMEVLQWGRVGDYFAHRWTDPTFLAGLALSEAHWDGPKTAFELACGIGHHLRALHQQGVAVTGSDVVFAKLWVARHWVVPEATLICFDATHAWPLDEQRFDLVACHDAFYFFAEKLLILGRLRALSAGVVLIGHIHNSDRHNLSAGAALSAEELAALIPDGILFDDAELTQALVEHRAPRAATPEQLRDAEAFAVAIGTTVPQSIEGRLGRMPDGGLLSRNPLYGTDGAITWPSERYKNEYAGLATYPMHSDLPLRLTVAEAPDGSIQRRELVDLPERW